MRQRRPHDTILAAAGLSRYGLRDEALRLIGALVEASSRFENQRLPELFAGVERIDGFPIPFKGANVPPSKERRNQRLLECVGIIRGLLNGETVTVGGEATVDQARLWTLPSSPPELFAAAVTPATAAWAASWSDGLVTVYQPNGKMEEVIRAYRDSGGDGKPVKLQVQHAFARTDAAALAGAMDQWRQAVLPSSVMTDMRLPGQIDEASALARSEDVAARVRASAEPEQHLEWLCEYRRLGVETAYVHNVTREQELFIDAFGTHVLPALRT